MIERNVQSSDIELLRSFPWVCGMIYSYGCVRRMVLFGRIERSSAIVLRVVQMFGRCYANGEDGWLCFG